jgi:hypothetical protein
LAGLVRLRGLYRNIDLQCVFQSLAHGRYFAGTVQGLLGQAHGERVVAGDFPGQRGGLLLRRPAG